MLGAFVGASDDVFAEVTRLGRIFERTYSSVVAVASGEAWRAGFVIGTRGEVLVGPLTDPPGAAGGWEARLASGRRVRARVIARRSTTGLTLLRLPEEEGEPVPLAWSPGLEPWSEETWLLVLAVDERGAPEPFAGVIVETASAGKGSARLMATAVAGSAVLDVEGRLVGVALDSHRRFTRVVPLSALTDWLREASP